VKKKDLKWHKKRMDTVFSQYIRRLYADEDGIVSCFTCRVKKHWKEMQCGHYISRNHLSTRFEEKNVAPQCPGCNVWGGGKHDVFAVNLIKKYGEGILEELAEIKRNKVKFRIFDYVDMIDTYEDHLVGMDMKNG